MMHQIKIRYANTKDDCDRFMCYFKKAHYPFAIVSKDSLMDIEPNYFTFKNIWLPLTERQVQKLKDANIFEKQFIASRPLSNFHSMLIYSINEHYVRHGYSDNHEVHKSLIKYTQKGDAYFVWRNTRWHLKEFLRTNFVSSGGILSQFKEN